MVEADRHIVHPIIEYVPRPHVILHPVICVTDEQMELFQIKSVKHKNRKKRNKRKSYSKQNGQGDSGLYGFLSNWGYW